MNSIDTLNGGVEAVRKLVDGDPAGALEEIKQTPLYKEGENLVQSVIELGDGIAEGDFEKMGNGILGIASNDLLAFIPGEKGFSIGAKAWKQSINPPSDIYSKTFGLTHGAWLDHLYVNFTKLHTHLYYKHVNILNVLPFSVVSAYVFLPVNVNKTKNPKKHVFFFIHFCVHSFIHMCYLHAILLYNVQSTDANKNRRNSLDVRKHTNVLTCEWGPCKICSDPSHLTGTFADNSFIIFR